MAIVLSFTLVIMSAITFMLAVNVFIYDDINQKHNQHYVVLCGASSIWSLSHGSLGLCNNEVMGAVFRSIAYIGVFVVTAKGILLASYWTEMSKTFQKWLQRYVTFASILIYPMIIEKGSVQFVHTKYGYYCTFNPYPGRTAFLIYTWTIFIIGLTIVYHGFKYSKRTRQRKMALSTLVCLGVFATGMIFDSIVPLFGIASFPASAFAQFISVLLVYMASLRYNVSRMTIANISEYIYSYVKTPIVILDENSQIQLGNSAASSFFKIPPDQVIGKDASVFFEVKKEAIQDGGVGSMFGECKLNGAKCDLSINEILDRYGEPLGKLVVITDMTDRINLIHKLDESMQDAIQANEAKSAFLANMSHEIRTPMNTIIGMSEILLRRELPEDVKQEVRLIRNSGTGLLNVINDVLDISKIESGKFEIIDAQYMLPSLLVDVVNMMSVRLVDKGIYFFVKVDENLPASLIGDNLRIKQILINIIGNAIKFTQKGFIMVDVSGTYIEQNQILLTIRVEDSGIGIRKEDMGKLFGIFNQVDTRKNHNIKGTGLGLAISKNLSELMDGNIVAESEYGKGTTFTIQIKQKVENRAPIGNIQNKEEIVLVLVEQEEIMIRYFSRVFEEMGIQYIHCSTIEEVQQLTSCTYCLIRKATYEKMCEGLQDYIPKDKLILILNVGEEMGKDRNELHHVSLPLCCFQLVNILNHGKEVYSYAKEEYSPGQIKPLPFASVLIVDDNETNLYVAKGMMSTYRMEIDTAASGYDALVLIKKKKYDLIFMDHMMPELDGIDTTKKIRGMEDEYYRKVPIVALTANAMSGAREQFMKAGFDDFLAKPIEFKELDRVLREFVLPHAPKDYKEMLEKIEQEKTIESTSSDYALHVLAGHMEGINIKERVAVFGGNIELYVNILRTYYEDISRRKEELRSFYLNGEFEQFRISVHALKSASYNVGADNLGKMAELLEHAGKENDGNWIQNNIGEFFEKLEQTIQTVAGFLEFIDEMDDKEVQPKEPMEYLTRMYLERLIEYCEEMDFVSLEQEVAHLRHCSYEKHQCKLAYDLINAYDEFEYEKFIELIKEYLAQKNEKEGSDV